MKGNEAKRIEDTIRNGIKDSGVKNPLSYFDRKRCFMVKAYIILVHKNPEQLSRLIKKLDDGVSVFFVHIDKKVPLESFRSVLDLKDKVHLVKRVITIGRVLD